MKIFLHIGAHKTGSTLIQSMFDANRKILATHGVVYPKCNWYHHAHHRLAFALRGMRDLVNGDEPNFQKEIEDLHHCIENIPKDSKLLISSEELFSLPKPAIMSIRDSLSAHDLKVVAYVRRPDDLLISTYNQKVKSAGNDFSFQIETFLDDPNVLTPDLAMPTCVRLWSEVFGQNNVILRRYEDENPLVQMLESLGLPKDLISSDKVVNRSVPACVAELVRLSKIVKLPPVQREAIFQLGLSMFRNEPSLEPGMKFRRTILSLLEADFEKLFASFGMKNTYSADIVPEDLAPSPALKPVFLLLRVISGLLKEKGIG